MMIYLYKTNSDPRVVSKTTWGGIAVECTIKGECSTIRPHFAVARGDNGYFNGYNLLYSVELGRYYFIEDITISPGGIVVFNCMIDPLMSYSASIRGLVEVVATQEFDYDLAVGDDSVEYIRSGHETVKIWEGPIVGDTNYTYYLTTVGATGGTP